MQITRESVVKYIKDELKYNPESIGRAFSKVMDQIFSPYTMIGGYTLIFIEDHTNGVFCDKCARKEFLTNNISMSIGTYDEGENIYCDECNKE